MDLNDSVKNIKGIGEKTAGLLLKLGIATVDDLLRHYPRGYDRFKIPVSAKDVVEGETAAVEGVVSRVTVNNGRRCVVSCYLSDPGGAVKLKWFNQKFMVKILKPGYRFLFRGQVKRDNAEYCIVQPKMYKREEYIRLLDHLSPVYDLTKGITGNIISKAVRIALDSVELEEKLPPAFRKENDLMKLSDAVYTIHFPKNEQEALKARRRLVFDEFLEFMAALNKLKQNKVEEKNGYVVSDFSACAKLIGKLPYKLTEAQKKVLKDIASDIASDRLMSRMVEGDVGSGKTIIALLAVLAVAEAGHQAAVMVPTEVLAKQHFAEFSGLLADTGLKVALLVGSMTSAQKKAEYSKLFKGETDIVIGTHALIQESVGFNDLGIVVIDEQHRFGVNQRKSLRDKGLKPHVLTMSATPIPRSLSLILYGDMDLSVLDEMPAERLPIKNCVVDTGYRPKALDFIGKEVAAGHQAYIICPMVEYSEDSDGENVTDHTEDIREYYSVHGFNKDGKSINIGCLHGKMKPSEKNEIMQCFADGGIDVLVSTTVVEVGVNVKNATVMMIENSERFGLAQLHQLRGRVGRGSSQSYCIFMKGHEGKDIDERLDILKNNNNGFKVAEEDLRLRGPGDLFGVRQAGEMSWKLADIFADASLLSLASEYAKSLS